VEHLKSAAALSVDLFSPRTRFSSWVADRWCETCLDQDDRVEGELDVMLELVSVRVRG
jgi:hypothetical protein